MTFRVHPAVPGGTSVALVFEDGGIRRMNPRPEQMKEFSKLPDLLLRSLEVE